MQAYYYDGRSSRRQTVTLKRDSLNLLISGDDIQRSVTLDQIKLAPALGSAPRRIELPDGGFCEVSASANLHEIFEKTQADIGWVARMENSLRWTAFALLTTAAVVFSAYRWGLPYASKQIADRIPVELTSQWSAQSFEWADKHIFLSTQIAPSRQQKIRQALTQLQPSQTTLPYRLHFRHSKHVGANALALPSGDIIVTDDLIKLAANDDEVVAVLAHELGHVSGRHSLRSALQSAGIAMMAMALFGDFTSVMAQLSAITQLSYSREMENEADSYAIKLLNQHGKSAQPLATMLDKLVQHARPKSASKDEGSDFLATHPTTEQRIQNIRKQDKVGKANPNPP